MNGEIAVRRALDAIAHLGDPEPPWADLLEAMTGLIGGDSATLIVLEGSGELLTFQQHNLAQVIQDEYARHFCAQDIMAAPTRGASSGSWFDSYELFSPSQLSRNAYTPTSCAATAPGACWFT